MIDGSLSDCGWFGKEMKQWREDGYDCEILFVVSCGPFTSSVPQDRPSALFISQSAPEEKMLERAARRAKITGRVILSLLPWALPFTDHSHSLQYTDPESIRYSRLKSPECVTRLSTPSHVKRVRFVNNASDNAAPEIMYDSARDPEWNEREEELGRGKVDVKGFVEGRCSQGEDGKVRRVPGTKEVCEGEEECKSCDEEEAPRRKAAM